MDKTLESIRPEELRELEEIKERYGAMNEKQTKEMIDHILTELKKLVDSETSGIRGTIRAYGGELSDLHRKLRIATKTYELNLRDQFAAAALEGYCSNIMPAATTYTLTEIAELAYDTADAMLAAREGKEFIPVKSLVGPCPKCRANADPLVNGWCNSCRLYWHIGGSEGPVDE